MIIKTIKNKYFVKNSWVQIFIAAMAVVLMLGAFGVWMWCVNKGFVGGGVNWNWQAAGYVRIECFK